MPEQKAFTREEIRELDRKAIEEYGIPGVVLMENAGRGAAEEILKMLTPASNLKETFANPPKVVILAGKGNNGGDGFVIARHLHNKGVELKTYLTAKLNEILPEGDAGTNLEILLNMDINVGEVVDLDCVSRLIPDLDEADIIVDALLGTGLSGEVREPIGSIIYEVNKVSTPVVAIDTPSGLDCNNGVPLGLAVKAAKTVTFVAPKVGFYKNEGPALIGELVVIDIGIPRELLNK